MEPPNGARFGLLTVLAGNAKNKKSRNVPLSARAVEILKLQEPKREGLVFHRADGKPLQASLLGQQQKRVRDLLKFPADFVLHSLRHTFGTRLVEAGADAFTIMRLMGHSTVTVSQRYVHPSPEAVELAFGRLVELNSAYRVGIDIGIAEQAAKSVNLVSCLFLMCPGGEIGRRNGLKIKPNPLSRVAHGLAALLKPLKRVCSAESSSNREQPF